ncbi:MAG TPA: amidohydrolase family protein [Candidatus Cybelea sp.]
MKARYVVDVHAHLGASPSIETIAESVHSAKDWPTTRTKHPQEFAKIPTERQTDNSETLLEVMDRHGVTHALIQSLPVQPPPGEGTELVAAAAKKHKDRLFPLYRPDFFLVSVGMGKMSGDPEVLAENSRRVVDDIERKFPELGFIGHGEILPSLVTREIDPAKISQAMRPMMEALQAKNAPIQIATSYTGMKGNLYYGDPLWVDELAGDFPQVPIVLVKMGRGFNRFFEACLVVALRNANVFLETTNASPQHVRVAIDKLGPQRIMFGTDLHEVSKQYCYDEEFATMRSANVTDDEWEWIGWRTANEVYKLGLN